jgi:hypothetical protein
MKTTRPQTKRIILKEDAPKLTGSTKKNNKPMYIRCVVRLERRTTANDYELPTDRAYFKHPKFPDACCCCDEENAAEIMNSTHSALWFRFGGRYCLPIFKKCFNLPGFKLPLGMVKLIFTTGTFSVKVSIFHCSNVRVKYRRMKLAVGLRKVG